MEHTVDQQSTSGSAPTRLPKMQHGTAHHVDGTNTKERWFGLEYVTCNKYLF